MHFFSNKILIVEDDPKLVTELREAFVQHGYEVDTAADGLQGLERLMKGIPGLIVADFIMPRMNGIEFIRVLRNTPQFADIPVIVLSAKNDIDFRLEALRTGASRYLIKDSSPPAVVVANAEALLRRLPSSPDHAPPAPPTPAPVIPAPNDVKTLINGEDDLPEIKGLEPVEMERFEEGRDYFSSGKYYEAYEIWKDLESSNPAHQDLKMWVGIARQNVRKIAFKAMGSKEHQIRIVRDLASYQRLSPEEGVALSRLRNGMTVDEATKAMGWDSIKTLYVLLGLHEKGALKTDEPPLPGKKKQHS